MSWPPRSACSYVSPTPRSGQSGLDARTFTVSAVALAGRQPLAADRRAHLRERQPRRGQAFGGAGLEAKTEMGAGETTRSYFVSVLLTRSRISMCRAEIASPPDAHRRYRTQYPGLFLVVIVGPQSFP
jgi:hypothetical protein